MRKKTNHTKFKAYILFFIGALCVMFVGLGYVVSYIDHSYDEWFSLGNKFVIIVLLIIVPVIGYFSIKRGVNLLKNKEE